MWGKGTNPQPARDPPGRLRGGGSNPPRHSEMGVGAGRSRPASGCRYNRCTATRFRRRPRSGSRTTPTTSISRFSATTPIRRRSRRRSRAATTSGRTTGSGSASTRSAPGQLSYHLMVNPSGVQLDMLNSVAGRRRPVARLRLGQRRPAQRQTGYAVEMRVPLQTIRFQGGGDVRMGILFWRRVSRPGVSVVVAAARARQVGVREARAAAFDDLSRA